MLEKTKSCLFPRYNRRAKNDLRNSNRSFKLYPDLSTFNRISLKSEGKYLHISSLLCRAWEVTGASEDKENLEFCQFFSKKLKIAPREDLRADLKQLSHL